MPGDCRKDVDIIILEAKLIAGHLAMVPPHLGQAVIRDPEGDPETSSGAQDG
jgi:hypothetical protein